VTAGELRALRSTLLAIANGVSAALELLEDAMPDETAGAPVTKTEAPPEKLQPFFGRKPVDVPPSVSSESGPNATD